MGKIIALEKALKAPPSKRNQAPTDCLQADILNGRGNSEAWVAEDAHAAALVLPDSGPSGPPL